MDVKLKEFKVYAPPECKSHDLNSDGTLTITGIASTTNEDLDGEIVTPNALKSLAEQVIGLNLHLDHNHHYDGGIGVVTDAKLESNSLRITAVILSEYAKGIKERLDLGMNFGFSIGGIPIVDRSDSRKIIDFKLLEMSLTLLPANWDTFGTVETKGIVKSKCLTGACHYILKNTCDIMDKKDVNNQELVVNDEVKQMFIDIVNEAIYNLKPQLAEDLKGDIINDIRGELSTIVQDVVTPLLDDSEPVDEKDVEEDIVEESVEEPTDENSSEETVPEESSEEDEVVEDEKDITENITEESLEDCTDKKADSGESTASEEEPVEEVVEEEKELEEPPVIEEPAPEPQQEPAPAPKVVVDIKELGAEIGKQVSKEMSKKSFRDEIVKDITSELYKDLDAKRKQKSSQSESKFKQYSETTKKSKSDDEFLDSPKRDRFGRNRKFLSRN